MPSAREMLGNRLCEEKNLPTVTRAPVGLNPKKAVNLTFQRNDFSLAKGSTLGNSQPKDGKS